MLCSLQQAWRSINVEQYLNSFNTYYKKNIDFECVITKLLITVHNVLTFSTSLIYNRNNFIQKRDAPAHFEKYWNDECHWCRIFSSIQSQWQNIVSWSLRCFCVAELGDLAAVLHYLAKAATFMLQLCNIEALDGKIFLQWYNLCFDEHNAISALTLCTRSRA